MNLNLSQKEQLDTQLESHRHPRYFTDICLSREDSIKGLVVCADILRPDIMASSTLYRYLNNNRNLFKDKTVLDMGCGCGVQGLVMAYGGANKVMCTDVDKRACANTLENINRQNLTAKMQVVRGDLFEKVEGQYDCIVFNHPFFPADPILGVPVSKAMMDSGNLLRRFFREVPTYLAPGGTIIMPYFDLAGKTNDPKLAKKYGFKVSVSYQKDVNEGLQKGKISIYEINMETEINY